MIPLSFASKVISYDYLSQNFIRTLSPSPKVLDRGRRDGWLQTINSPNRWEADHFSRFVWQINAVHCGVGAQVPEYVRKAKLAWFSSHSRPEACVPLFREAAKSQTLANVDHGSPQCVTAEKNSFVHGVCFKDFAALDRCLLALILVHYIFLLLSGTWSHSPVKCHLHKEHPCLSSIIADSWSVREFSKW